MMIDRGTPLGAPVAKIAKNFGQVKNITPPPLPIKKKFPKEPSFSATDSAIYSSDLRKNNAPPPPPPVLGEVISASRRALNLETSSNARNNRAAENGKENNNHNYSLDSVNHQNFQKIYFGHQITDSLEQENRDTPNLNKNRCTNNRSTGSNGDNLMKRQIFQTRNHNVEPLIRNPTLSELLDLEIRSKTELSSSPRSSIISTEFPLAPENKLDRVLGSRSPVDRPSRFDCSPSVMSSMEVDSLQALEEISTIHRRNAKEKLSQEMGRRASDIQNMPLPEIPVNSASNLTSRTLVNLRQKQPVKAAVRIIENETGESPQPPKTHVRRKQSISNISDQQDKQSDRRSPKPREEYFHERYQHQFLIEEEPKKLSLKSKEVKRKRYKNLAENVNLNSTSEGKTMLTCFSYMFVKFASSSLIQ